MTQPHKSRLDGTGDPEKTRQFRELMGRETGSTSLLRARNLGRDLGIPNLYLKFEAGNPTGTHKDRIAFAHCLDALELGQTTISVATCGNYGAAVSHAAQLAGLNVVVFIPAGFHSPRIPEMEAAGASIRRVPGSYEDTVVASREAAFREGWYDANPGDANADLQLKAYAPIAAEIVEQLGAWPGVVACPVSNGTLLGGLYLGFEAMASEKSMPHLVAGSSYGKNPVVHAFLKRIDSCIDLPPAKIKETPTNEPLVNWHSFDGEVALEAIRKTEGWAVNVSDQRMQAMSRLLRMREGLSVLPAATAGLVALARTANQLQFTDQPIVALLTGKK